MELKEKIDRLTALVAQAEGDAFQHEMLAGAYEASGDEHNSKQMLEEAARSQIRAEHLRGRLTELHREMPNHDETVPHTH